MTLTIRMHGTLWKKARNECTIPLYMYICIMFSLRIFLKFFLSTESISREKNWTLRSFVSTNERTRKSTRRAKEKTGKSNYTASLQTHFLKFFKQCCIRVSNFIVIGSLCVWIFTWVFPLPVWDGAAERRRTDRLLAGAVPASDGPQASGFDESGQLYF